MVARSPFVDVHAIGGIASEVRLRLFELTVRVHRHGRIRLPEPGETVAERRQIVLAQIHIGHGDGEMHGLREFSGFFGPRGCRLHHTDHCCHGHAGRSRPPRQYRERAVPAIQSHAIVLSHEIPPIPFLFPCVRRRLRSPRCVHRLPVAVTSHVDDARPVAWRWRSQSLRPSGRRRPCSRLFSPVE